MCFIAAMNCSVQIHTAFLLRSKGESIGLGFQAGSLLGVQGVMSECRHVVADMRE